MQYWPKTGDNTSNFKAYLYTNYNPTSDGGSSDTRLQVSGWREGEGVEKMEMNEGE